MTQGPLKEVETHILLARRVGLATPGDVATILSECEAVGKMLRALIRALQARQKA